MIMMRKQFFRNCRYCGKQILMVRNTESGRYTPCDTEIRRYIPNPDGNILYVNEDGQGKWGFVSEPVFGSEFGYLKHYTSCNGRKDA